MATQAPYLERYIAGEHEQVWAELQSLGAAVRDEPVFSDAMAVARETMRRVRHNIEALIPRLDSLGYTFGYAWANGRAFPSGHPDPVFAPPQSGVGACIAELEQRSGALPLSLRAFYEVVGAVNLVGEPPEAWSDWRAVPDGIDALYVYPIGVVLEEAERWRERCGDVSAEQWRSPAPGEEDLCDSQAYAALPPECWLIPIAPDEWHKYDISGCGAYEIAVPTLTADARLLTERHHSTFVDYLRRCLRWAGFPKLENVPGAPSSVSGLAALTQNLLPF